MADEKKANEITPDEIRESLKRLEAKIQESSTNSVWFGLMFVAVSIIVASSPWTSWDRIAWGMMGCATALVGELLLWKPWRKKK
jgi:hypothetical protein